MTPARVPTFLKNYRALPTKDIRPGMIVDCCRGLWLVTGSEYHNGYQYLQVQPLRLDSGADTERKDMVWCRETYLAVMPIVYDFLWALGL